MNETCCVTRVAAANKHFFRYSKVSSNTACDTYSNSATLCNNLAASGIAAVRICVFGPASVATLPAHSSLFPGGDSCLCVELTVQPRAPSLPLGLHSNLPCLRKTAGTNVLCCAIWEHMVPRESVTNNSMLLSIITLPGLDTD